MMKKYLFDFLCILFIYCLSSSRRHPCPFYLYMFKFIPYVEIKALKKTKRYSHRPKWPGKLFVICQVFSIICRLCVFSIYYTYIYKICELWHLPGGGVGGIGTVFGLDLPNVVNAVELTPNNTMNTPNNIVKLPHCVKRFNGCILDHKIYWLFILLSVQKLSLTISL